MFPAGHWRRLLQAGFALAALACASGTRAAERAEYLVDVWQTDDGLPHSSVTAIAQTPDGYLWVGTYNGLARFDGVRFTVFDPGNTPALAHARVAWLGVDARGELWVGTEDGSLAVREVHEGGEFRAVRVQGGGGILGKRLTFDRGSNVLLLARSGRLWRRTDSGGDPTLESLTPPGGGPVKDVGRDAAGNVWCLYGGGKLARWLGDRFDSSMEDAGELGRRIHSLEADAAGRVWIGTDRQLAAWDGERFQDITPTNDLTPAVFTGMSLSGSDGAWVVSNGRLRRCVARRWIADAGPWTNKFDPAAGSITEHLDARGGLWFTLYGGGLLHIPTNGVEQWIKSRDGLPGERIAAWCEDREGNIWLGLNRAGLVRLRERRFQVLGAEDGLRERTAMSVCEDTTGGIWVGTFGGGLHRWAHGVMETFDVGTRQPNIVVSVFPDRHGRVWMGTGGDGVFVWQQGKMEKPWNGAGAPAAGHALFEDRRGRVWMGNASGLFLNEGETWRRFGPADGFSAGGARAFAEDAAGALWIGTTAGAVYRFVDGQFTEFRPPDGPGRHPVWSLYADGDGTLWAGTFRGGLLSFREGRWTRITTRDGLSSDVICHILDDGAGQLWLGSHAGILRVAKSALHAFAQGSQKSVTCIAYGKSDGLPTVECSGNYQPAGWRGKDGRLWFATVKGVVSVPPRDVPVNPLPPPVVIEEVAVDGRSVTHTPASATLEVGPGRHYLEFRYTGLSLSASEKVRFRHRLEGLERSWVEDGTRRTANYSYIPPGQYRFRVLACNNDGVWNEEGAVLALSVAPFVWQTTWFRMLAGLTLLGLVGGTMRFLERRKMRRQLERAERQRAVERERTRIAQDMHDELGSKLAKISFLSELARDGRSPPGEAEAHVHAIAGTSRDVLRALDELVWAVNPKNDSLEHMAGYLCRHAREYFENTGVECEFEMPPRLPEVVMATDVRHNLMLAFEEALANVLKHGAASRVAVRLTLENRRLEIVITDNGRGFRLHTASPQVPAIPAQSRRRGHGLPNMRQRLSELGGDCVIESTPGEGTRVTFTLAVEMR